MALTIALNSKTSTSITVDLAGRTTVTYDTVEFQYSTRADFNFTLAPLASYATVAQVALQYLNQGNTYFVRAREKVAASGIVGPWTTAISANLPLASVQSTAPLSLMVSPAIIVVPETVTWSVTNPANGYPADNLSTDAPNEQMWTSGTGLTLRLDTPGSPIDTIALLGTNIPIGATWTMYGYNVKADRDAGNGNYTYTQLAAQFHASPNLPGRPFYNGLARLGSVRIEPYWLITFTGGTVNPPASVFVAMFAVAGLAKTAKNIAADKVETPLDYGALTRTRDGVPDRNYGWRGRRVEFEIAVMTEAQWETQFADLRYRIGLTDPVLVVPNTRTGAFLHDRILYGPITTQRATFPHASRMSHSFSVDSLI